MGQPPRRHSTRSPRSEAEPRDAIGPRSNRLALLRTLLGRDGRILVVSNRGPITFEQDPGAPDGPAGDLNAARGPGGLVTALAELGRHAPLTWVAAALTEADRLAAPHLDPASKSRDGGRVRELAAGLLPGQDVRLVYVPVPVDIYERHYGVIANPFLWFLQHEMYATAYAPNVDETLLEAWRHGYRPVNELLADAAVEAVGPDKRPVVLVQDYHLYLAPERIRERLPKATILHFNHIPWPADSQWQLIPQAMRRAICEGLLGCDIVGFQTDRYASHFLDSVSSFVRDAKVDRDSRNVAWRGRRIRVRTYPISVDPEGLDAFSRSEAVEGPLARLVERLERAGNPRLIVRADRIEPSKNALRGFLAFEAMLERRPELRRTVRFVAVQAPTRTEIAEYSDYAAAVREVVARINRMDEPEDQPVWVYDGSDYGMAIAALRLADVVVVNPIVDGMNLVAKEAVLVGERDPVLVLSETAGAAEQLAADSVSVAPADVAGTTAALERALAMDPDERRTRLRRMRASVRQEDLDWWLARQLRDLAAIRRGHVPPSRRLRDTVRRVEEVPV